MIRPVSRWPVAGVTFWAPAALLTVPPPPQVLGAGPVPLRGPVHVGPLAGGADGVAEAIRLAPHPPQAAAGEHALHGELHGDPHREVDELPLPGESGAWGAGLGWGWGDGDNCTFCTQEPQLQPNFSVLMCSVLGSVSQHTRTHAHTSAHKRLCKEISSRGRGLHFERRYPHTFKKGFVPFCFNIGYEPL